MILKEQGVKSRLDVQLQVSHFFISAYFAFTSLTHFRLAPIIIIIYFMYWIFDHFNLFL